MKTVKEAFEKAYGPLPEGATCHVGVFVSGGVYQKLIPSIRYVKEDGSIGELYFLNGNAVEESSGREPQIPAICNEEARVFIGWFGPEYDKAVSE